MSLSNHNLKNKIILAFIILIEIVVGFFFLFSFYQKKIVHKAQDADKAAIIDKENLVFPEQSEFQYYYELKPNTEVIDQPDWLGYQVKYTYNADGLNERFDYEVEKPSDTFRIITLGDSFTFGHYVNTKDNWPEQLEDLLNRSLETDSKIKKFEVINLGMAAWDVPYLVKRYKDIGAKYNPDLIIWFESGEGFYRMVELIMPLVDVCEKEISDNDREKELHYCWNLAGKKFANDYSRDEVSSLIMNDLESLLISLKNNENFIFFTFQEEHFGESKVYAWKQWKERFLGFPHVFFAALIPNIYNLNQTLADNHPNAQGHKTIANTIYEYLKDNVLLQEE